MLEVQGFCVGIIVQLDWSSKDDFMCLGKLNLFFGVIVGNMDLMINCYIVDCCLCYDDVYMLDNVVGKCLDCVILVYIQCCKEVWKDVLVIFGGIEVSLCCIVYYDYWFDIVCCFVLVDLKVDMLMFGNGECLLVEVVYCLVMGELISEICDVCNIVIIVKEVLLGWSGVDFICFDIFGKIDLILYLYGEDLLCVDNKLVMLKKQEVKVVIVQLLCLKLWEKIYVLLFFFEKVKGDKVLYVYVLCILYYEINLGCVCVLM